MPGGDSCNILRFTISNFLSVMDPSIILARSNCILVGGNRFNY